MAEDRVGADAWRERRIVADRRRVVRERLAHFMSLHVLVTVILWNVRKLVGAEADISNLLLPMALALVVAFDALTLLWRRDLLDRVGEVMLGGLRAVTKTISLVLLLAVYLLMVPFGVSVGKRAYLKRRPQHGAWFGAGAWRVSTWTAKRSEAIPASRRHRLHLLGRAHAGGGYYILLLALLVLIAASINAAAASSKLAPFIYTLF
jgi:hypothetical protein